MQSSWSELVLDGGSFKMQNAVNDYVKKNSTIQDYSDNNMSKILTLNSNIPVVESQKLSKKNEEYLISFRTPKVNITS